MIQIVKAVPVDVSDAIINDEIIQTDEKPKETIMDTLSKQEGVETKPQAEDMENEVEAIQRKTPDDNDNAKEKIIRDKASAILESWSQLQVCIFNILRILEVCLLLRDKCFLSKTIRNLTISTQIFDSFG